MSERAEGWRGTAASEGEGAAGRCAGLVGWLFGHRYEARYSVGPPLANANLKGYDLAGLIEATKPRTYEGDVCQRCGRTVNRPRSLPDSESPENPANPSSRP